MPVVQTAEGASLQVRSCGVRCRLIRLGAFLRGRRRIISHVFLHVVLLLSSGSSADRGFPVCVIPLFLMCVFCAPFSRLARFTIVASCVVRYSSSFLPSGVVVVVVVVVVDCFIWGAGGDRYTAFATAAS